MFKGPDPVVDSRIAGPNEDGERKAPDFITMSAPSIRVDFGC